MDVGTTKYKYLFLCQPRYTTADNERQNYDGVLISLSLTRRETSYSDQTWDLFNILPTKPNRLLSPLL